MESHRQFDQAVERYETFNRGRYDKDAHAANVRTVVVHGQLLLRALGAEQVAPIGDQQVLQEAAIWALQYVEALDRSNACMHCAPVRYSPITFRLARALRDAGVDIETVTNVLAHDGAYQEDPGR